MLDEDIKRFATTVEDAVAFPILTRSTGRGESGRSHPTQRAGSANGTAQQTLRDVLGWRYRSDDGKGFLAALNKSFSPRPTEGRVEWDWKPQSYMLQADLGAITGAQASIHKQASIAVEQALPLLDGLTSLRADVDLEDSEAMRSIIASELRQLVDELAQVGGPRVERVNLIFQELLGEQPSDDPEAVQGQLLRLRERLGLQRGRVNTVAEEQNLTNFLILVDYINGLYRSWRSKLGFFSRGSGVEPFLGTQLVLLSQVLEVIVEQLHETYDAMDSVFFGAAERQATLLELPGSAPITVAELLDWVEGFASAEGRKLIEDGGKDGIVIFRQTLERLTSLIDAAAVRSRQLSANPTRAFHTARVSILLDGLTQHMRSGIALAGGIQRAPFVASEVQTPDENVSLPAIAQAYPRQFRITRVEVVSRREGKQARFEKDARSNVVHPGTCYRVVLYGENLLHLSADFGDGIETLCLESVSNSELHAHVQVDDDAAEGPRDLIAEDAFSFERRYRAALCVVPDDCDEQDALREAKLDGCVVAARGASVDVKIAGSGLSGAGVYAGDDIKTKRIHYFQGGLVASLELANDARPGPRKLRLFTATGHRDFRRALDVEAAQTAASDELIDEDDDDAVDSDDATTTEAAMAHGSDAAKTR